MNSDLKIKIAMDSDGMSEAIARIEKFLSHSIPLVLPDPKKPRCFYCGSLNEEDANQCTQCGAPL